MSFLFYGSSALALAAAILAVTRKNAFHALLYLVVSLVAVAAALFALGAAFAAALEIIVYAGAIVVLFIFVVMLLNLGETASRREAGLLQPSGWIGPAVLAGLLLAELIYVLAFAKESSFASEAVDPKEVALTLFGPYLLAVEIASFLLLAGLVGAYHLGSGMLPEAGEEKVERTAEGGAP